MIFIDKELINSIMIIIKGAISKASKPGNEMIAQNFVASLSWWIRTKDNPIILEGILIAELQL